MTAWTSSELLFTSNLMLQTQQHVTVPQQDGILPGGQKITLLAFKHGTLKQFAFFLPQDSNKTYGPGQLIYMAEAHFLDTDGSISLQRRLRVRYFETVETDDVSIYPVDATSIVFTQLLEAAEHVFERMGYQQVVANDGDFYVWVMLRLRLKYPYLIGVDALKAVSSLSQTNIKSYSDDVFISR